MKRAYMVYGEGKGVPTLQIGPLSTRSAAEQALIAAVAVHPELTFIGISAVEADDEDDGGGES